MGQVTYIYQHEFPIQNQGFFSCRYQLYYIYIYGSYGFVHVFQWYIIKHISYISVPCWVLWVTFAAAFFQAKDVRPLEARQRLPSVFSASCSSVVDPKRSGEGQVVMVVGSCQGGGLVVLFFFGVGMVDDENCTCNYRGYDSSDLFLRPFIGSP